ncbi:sigma factor-like helix-turn-helix DNA-binding protein [Lysinibacillus fusiformis]|nr:sigma factor-like helix-turn-helix DNA-binding protein [Lysinibacillus fusiformis]
MVLYYFEEMKIHDIARLLGVSDNTVKTRLRRAREALRSYLKQDEWEVLKDE